MRVRYETGIATFIQLVVGVLLSFLGGLASIIAGCTTSSNGGDCVSNAFVSLILIMLTVMAYGFLLALGYVAQERRSPRLAYLLMALELFAMIIFLFDARHAPGVIDLLTNLVSLAIAVWVIYVAWQLSRAKGGRLVRSRPLR